MTDKKSFPAPRNEYGPAGNRYGREHRDFTHEQKVETLNAALEPLRRTLGVPLRATIAKRQGRRNSPKFVIEGGPHYFPVEQVRTYAEVRKQIDFATRLIALKG